ncbi:4-hydroxy-tetrahydrodipicolinate synthase [Oleiagrimonas sp. C23AA]|uniref:4-hydroxy-tetrahydrodipicolinate synthase n=1 Tax=Oleiagrimonas sp. C23AA TaxID=2719047 RepID=UPI0014226953|nr:4-hydroxy-tetrahydrodipicolinate synthase [Oleiagrimonas sp. C23AA]NII11819.1 4-hydroxy-tetrahydrodipicolinate synthase [Oleiagrimonas sp. C23AA]
MNIRGSICALATPFGDDGALDLDAFRRLIEQQIEAGTQALVVAGSTGEAHFLEHAEYERLLVTAVEQVRRRVPVIAGTGEAGTAKSLAMTRWAKRLGAHAALVVTPYYVRPTQEGLVRHFTEIADHGELPVILYNVPGRTGCDMLPDTVARLAEHAHIIGVKEARGDAGRIAAMAELAREDFVYLSGDDASCHEAMLAGAAGTISVVANVVPGLFRQLCDRACERSRAPTVELAERLEPLLDALDCAPNPIAIKAALAEIGIGNGALRLPLVALAEGAERARLREALSALLS